MFRRIEDKIRRLSEQLLAAKDDQELTTILGELRDALHQHVERLRARAANYPIVLERRSYPPTETSSRERQFARITRRVVSRSTGTLLLLE